MNALIVIVGFYLCLIVAVAVFFTFKKIYQKKHGTAYELVHPVEHEYWRRYHTAYDFIMRFKHRSLLGERLAITITMHYGPISYEDHINGVKRHYYRRVESWVSTPAHQLQSNGYLKCEGIHDSIIWWGVPAYVKLYNCTKYDAHTKIDGQFVFAQDTAATLHDYMQSNATMDFVKGMGKTSLPAMDLQKIGMIAIVGVSAILGLYMLGII